MHLCFAKTVVLCICSVSREFKFFLSLGQQWIKRCYMRLAKALIRLRKCTVWSLSDAKASGHIYHGLVHIRIYIYIKKKKKSTAKEYHSYNFVTVRDGLQEIKSWYPDISPPPPGHLPPCSNQVGRTIPPPIFGRVRAFPLLQYNKGWTFPLPSFCTERTIPPPSFLANGGLFPPPPAVEWVSFTSIFCSRAN